MGSLHEQSIVKVEAQRGLFILMFNTFLPGTGTIIAGFLVGGDSVENNLLVGILQMFMTCLVVGWLWSVYTGFLIYNKSRERFASDGRAE